VQIINTQSETILLTLEGNDFNIVAMAWSPDAAYLAGITASGQMTIWTTADGGVISRRRGVGAVSWTGDGRYLLGGSQDGQIIFWDTTNSDNQWQISRTWPTEDDAAIVWLQWLNDPPRLLSWNEEGWLRLRDGESGALLAERGHFNASLYNAVSDLAWSPDGRYLAAGSWDATIRIWQTDGMTVSQILRDHHSYIGPVDWSPDGEWIASGSIDGGGTLRLRALNEEEAITIPVDEEGPPRSLAFSPDGRWLAVGLESGEISLRSMPPTPSEIILSGTATDDRISGLAWSSNSQQLVAASRNGTITVWQIPGGALLQQWRVEEAAFDMVVAVSPTEPVIALARSMSEIELWSSDNWGLIRTIAGVPGVSVNQIAYSPDGRWLAMVGGRENVVVFSTATGEIAYVGTGHAAAVRSVIWSPTTPNHLASGGDDGVIRLWLLPEGQPGR
jgi:WD40 repeat protein